MIPFCDLRGDMYLFKELTPHFLLQDQIEFLNQLFCQKFHWGQRENSTIRIFVNLLMAGMVDGEGCTKD